MQIDGLPMARSPSLRKRSRVLPGLGKIDGDVKRPCYGLPIEFLSDAIRLEQAEHTDDNKHACYDAGYGSADG